MNSSEGYTVGNGSGKISALDIAHALRPKNRKLVVALTVVASLLVAATVIARPQRAEITEFVQNSLQLVQD